MEILEVFIFFKLQVGTVVLLQLYFRYSCTCTEYSMLH